MDRLFSGVPSGKKVDFKIEGTKTENKLRVLFVDKPKRTQCQLLFSLRTMPFSHEDYPAFYLFNQAFGGGFTSRLMTEVRVKRGWSYGAYSSIYDRFSGDYYVAYTFPALKDTLPAIKLVREMFAKVHKDGITKEEFEFARDMAINKHPFGFDVPEKSMGKLNEEIELDLKRGFFFNFPEKLKLLTLESVNKAAKKWLPNDNFMLTIVAPKEELLEEVKKLFPKAEVKVVNFQDI